MKIFYPIYSKGTIYVLIAIHYRSDFKNEVGGSSEWIGCGSLITFVWSSISDGDHQ